MATASFAGGDSDTFGIEYEAGVIRADDGASLPIASVIAATTAPTRGAISADLYDSTLEFSTGICRSLEQAAADLRAASEAVRPALQSHGAALLGMGLHPWCAAHDHPPVDAPRYRDILDRLSWPGKRITTNGLQFHIGMPSGDRAVEVARKLRSHLPLLLALSASSPFRYGASTGLRSTRAVLFSAIPRSGPMPEFDGWRAYASYCDAMATADAMPTPQHAWWDCRLQPVLGTLEIRIADTVPDLDDVLALGALAWAMAVAPDRLAGARLAPALADENRWRAARDGVGAQFLIDDRGTTAPISTVVEHAVAALDDVAVDLGCRAELERCLDLGLGRRPHQHLVTPSADPAPAARRATDTMRIDW